ncbi:MAG: excinuclease ABC subunit B [Candidatus Tagabacteria bacterium CG_4_10_14_0_2_um_filter_40_13]|uniref:Excinuclease ABC subunit B n=2 Tax=Candidatus Tagaibacteriota TaxID=1817918 RepID=A0A2M7B9G0_9BACT|nr:MAG: excinuclease ABC subunit B [Candidatus Tagabacteria bacterium CG11_big_fil_rev_8_21_14_0_20_41_11]PIU99711.1 MAG: excinuclease ABC subunit B [Candidatus Tagabacteria bacterium CG03_land_8_20_14_0_80_41_22]PIZ56643.1 MAG: excinuclease ABC subunit B [Candidatus Tagabacteria bacterium CG_4_10_14_0_2_um_filter_40_13]PJC24979.1 MAG: excinuclease ABC subunit B [Candidatus Tagabacteria bacterium CG_4_9_14_0_2_um_filter_41_11]
MGIFKLKSNYKPTGDQPKAIEQLVKGVKNGDRYQTLLGVTGSGKTFTMANIISQFDMPVLVIAPNKVLAAQLYREYKNFFPENSVNYFVSYYDYYQPEAYMPITDTYIEKESMINEDIDRLRHKATSALLLRKDVIVVASVSCIYNLGVPIEYFGSALHLETGKFITRGDLLRQLVKMQFLRTSGALKRGYFRLRGDVFEISPASGESIFRIELEEQKIGEIALADPVTRKIKEVLNEIVIFPPKHFISSEPKREQAIKEIKKELKERLKFFEEQKMYLEAERLERRTRYDMEMLKTIGYCHGIENYSRHLAGKLAGDPPDTLLAYFPAGKFLTIIDESHIAIPQIRGMYEGDQARKNILVQYGWRLPSAQDNRPLKFTEFEKRVGHVICTSATPADWELKRSSQVVEQIIRPTGLIDPPVEVRAVFDKKTNKTQVDDLMFELKKIVKKKERAIVNVLTKKMAEDFSDFLTKAGFKVRWMHSDTKTLERAEILTNFRKGEFAVLVGVNLLREGLDLPEVTLVAILDADREGFLRSETSLIQTMGRTARNIDGRVILYADNITGSLKRAMNEAERRRKIQLAYNKKYGITPRSIEKQIENLLDLEK